VQGLRGWIIGIVLIAVIGGVAYIFRDRLSGSAGDLQVGDCFNEPAAATVVEEVQHQPCNEAHTSEVVFVGDLPDLGAYPSDAEVENYFTANCIPAYDAYTGSSFETDTDMDMGWFYPTTEGWNDGDREITCYAIRIDGATTTQSIKAP
jgi:hypothetical protein